MGSVDPAFTENLRRILAPALKDAGFTFDGRRVFRRRVGDCIQIVDVQVGNRFMQGKFTLNLAIYDPTTDAADVEPATGLPSAAAAHGTRMVREYDCDRKRRERLGMLLPVRFPALQKLPVFGSLFGAKDVWWSVSRSEDMDRAKDALFKYGVTWLEQHTPASSSSESR
jgi:hypothetical protein